MKSGRREESRKKRILLETLGIFFIVTGILQFILPVSAGNFVHFAWFSNHVIIILGIGILLRNRFLVTAELCIALISETLWSIDFFARLFFNTHIVGITNFVFDREFDFIAVLNLQHLLIVPLGLIALWHLGMDKNGWKGSLVHAFLLGAIGFLAGPEYNINCIFRSCIPAFEGIGQYMILWPILVFIMIFFSHVLLEVFNFIRREVDPT